jgi:serine/threonine-protein kinase
MLRGRTLPPAAPAPADDPDATRTEPLPVADRPAVPVRTRVVDDDDDDDVVPAAAPTGRSRWLMAGLSFAILAAVTSLWLELRPEPAPSRVAVAPAPARQPLRQPQVPPAAVAGSASQAPLPASAPGQVVAARPLDARTGKPSTGTGSAPPPRGPAGTTRTPAAGQVAQAQGPSARDAVQEHGMNGLVPPSVTCKDKVFLAKEYCVYNECQKAGFQAFPSCVRLREDAKLRESSKYGQ